MALERDYRIQRKTDGCSFVDPEGDVVFSVVPRTRPLFSLVLAVVIGFVVFMLTLFGTVIGLAFVLGAGDEMPIAYMAVGLFFAAYAGVKLGSLALTSRVFDIRCDGDRFEVRQVSQNEFSLEDADGAALATLERFGGMWAAPRWKASDRHGASIAEAVATNRIPDPIRRFVKGILGIACLIGALLTSVFLFSLVHSELGPEVASFVLLIGGSLMLVVFLFLISRTGPFVATVGSLALAFPLILLGGFLSHLESNVEVHADGRITARVTNQFGKSTFIVEETPNPSDRIFIWRLLAALVYS